MRLHPFAKYTGCGNDFLLFDNREKNFPLLPSVIQSLCSGDRGIQADGVILLEHPTQSGAHFRFRIFNPDGSEAEMCGNGLRCFTKWLPSLGYHQETYQIETCRTILTTKPVEQRICIEMGEPYQIQWNLLVRFEKDFIRLHYIDIGVPHVILFTEDVEEVNLVKLGPYLRNYSLWMPQGTNVTVAECKSRRKIKVRTYERGVEGETLACGTGATAAALAASSIYNMDSPIEVETRSGETMLVNFRLEKNQFIDVTLTGPAECLFIGEIELPEHSTTDCQCELVSGWKES